MNATALRTGFCIIGLCLGAAGATSGEKLVGNVALTPASGACAASAQPGAVAVNFVLPEGSTAPAAAGTVNRFRYNYLAAAANGGVPRVTISGEIRDFGVAGCTMSFSGPVLRYD